MSSSRAAPTASTSIVQACRDRGCDFDTGDDCISLKSGRGEEGYTINRPTEDVHISNCTFADYVWACIGIGSETSAGIRNVHIERCKCLAAAHLAIYIKSRPAAVRSSKIST